MSGTIIRPGTDIEAHEKLTGRFFFKPNGEVSYIDLGNVADYKNASERTYKTHMVAEYGYRRVNDEQVDVINERWEANLTEVGPLAAELLNVGTAGTPIAQAAKGVIAITSITRSSSTATVDTTAAHGLTSGDSVFISGATQAEYNGLFTVTVTDADTFTYTVTGTPASPATGTPVARTGYIRVTSAKLGRTFFLGQTGVSAVQVYNASSGALITASTNYTVDLNKGTLSILLAAATITDGMNLDIAFTAAARAFETTTPYLQPLRRGTVLLLETNQFSKEALRRVSFVGVISVISYPDQSGEFGKYGIRVTPTSDPTTRWRYTRT